MCSHYTYEGPSRVIALSSAQTHKINNSSKSKESSTVRAPLPAGILKTPQASTDAAASTTSNQKCDGVTNEYVHILYGHVHIRKALNMAKYFGLRMCTKGAYCKKVLACEACAVGKARKIGVNISGASTHIRAVAANKFVYLDLSTIREAGNIPVRNGVWVGVIDEFSGAATSLFVARKNAMVEAVCELFGDWREKGRPVDTVRCDNAGENRHLQARAQSSSWNLGLTFQYTSAHTPQQNALIEKFFETVYNRARATMIYANIPDGVKHLVCRHLILHLTNLFNLEPVTKGLDTKTKFEWWGVPVPRFSKHPHPWGESVVVLTKDLSTRKLDNRGTKMMYVGASLTHSGDTYKVFDPLTKRIHHSRNVTFRRKMYCRQDSSVSTDQPHPLDTTFEHVTVIYEDSATPLQPTPDTSTSPPTLQAEPVLPSLIPPPTDLSSESPPTSVSSVDTFTTCADSFAEGF